MNIWALEKDESIKLLLLLLTEQLGQNNFLIDESQELDPRAIRLLKADEQGISAYLYTYGQEPEHYGVHLELPVLVERSRSDDMEIHEGIHLERLVDMLCVHFDVIQGSALKKN
jgi:hypothetical protein